MSESEPSVDGLMELFERAVTAAAGGHTLGVDLTRRHHLAYAERLAAFPAGLKLQEPVAKLIQAAQAVYDHRYQSGAPMLGIYDALKCAIADALPLSPGDSKSESEVQTAHLTSRPTKDLQAALPEDTALELCGALHNAVEALEFLARKYPDSGLNAQPSVEAARNAIRRFRITEATAKARDTSVSEMVNRFLGWKLPPTFAPDAGIKFAPSNGMSRAEAYEKVGWWPVGTNLFTADEARAMFEYVLAARGT